MKKDELILKIAEKAGTNKSEANIFLTAFVDVVIAAVKDKDKVVIPGFGSFESSHRKARTGKNPSTGETINIAAKDVPKFKAGKAFKDSL